MPGVVRVPLRFSAAPNRSPPPAEAAEGRPRGALAMYPQVLLFSFVASSVAAGAAALSLIWLMLARPLKGKGKGGALGDAGDSDGEDGGPAGPGSLPSMLDTLLGECDGVQWQPLADDDPLAARFRWLMATKLEALCTLPDEEPLDVAVMDARTTRRVAAQALIGEWMDVYGGRATEHCFLKALWHVRALLLAKGERQAPGGVLGGGAVPADGDLARATGRMLEDLAGRLTLDAEDEACLRLHGRGLACGEGRLVVAHWARSAIGELSSALAESTQLAGLRGRRLADEGDPWQRAWRCVPVEDLLASPHSRQFLDVLLQADGCVGSADFLDAHGGFEHAASGAMQCLQGECDAEKLGAWRATCFAIATAILAGFGGEGQGEVSRILRRASDQVRKMAQAGDADATDLQQLRSTLTAAAVEHRDCVVQCYRRVLRCAAGSGCVAEVQAMLLPPATRCAIAGEMAARM